MNNSMISINNNSTMNNIGNSNSLINGSSLNNISNNNKQ